MSAHPSEKKTNSSRAEQRVAGAYQEPRIKGTMAYLSLGFEFLGAFLMLAGAGYGFDYLLSDSGRPGFGMIVGLFLGFAGGTWHLVRRSNELQELEEKYAADRRAAEESGVITSTTEDIHARVERVQRGVDDVHRKLGAALDRPVQKQSAAGSQTEAGAESGERDRGEAGS
ncbi:MAG: AtpZ/AtpI family protein [Leptospirales bacterium]|jgi:F0F1-type ATP synthase assembly protein I